MLGSRFIHTALVAAMAAPLCLSASLYAQSPAEHHGRKYKAPPETSHIEVHVTKKSNGKPIVNAAVVFNPSTKDGKDLGSMEVKTDPEGKAALDIIPTGSVVRVQVIASGFATFADDFTLDGPSRSIDVVLLRPQEQASSYVDNSGKESARKPGVQEPVRPPSTTAKPDDKSGTAPKPQ